MTLRQTALSNAQSRDLAVLTPDKLLSNLHAAASGRIEWGTALTAIANYLDLWLVQIMSFDAQNGQLLFTAYGGDGATPEAALDYVRHYNTIDPRVAPAMATPQEQWVDSREHHSPHFVANDRFYQEFLIPHGGGHLLGTKLLTVGTVQFLLALVDRHGGTPISAEKKHFLPALKLHLSESLQTFNFLRNAHAELGMAQQLLGQFTYPMLLIDETRGIWHRNNAAADWLGRKELVTEKNQYLHFIDKDEDGHLTEALHSLRLSEPPTPSTPNRRVIKLRGGKGGTSFAFLSSIRPENTMGAFGLSPGALLILHDPNADPNALDPMLLAECFDLTPAEARVAVRLATGATSEAIASQTATSHETIRTHIKKVLEKTGSGRQAELMRTLMGLPARLLFEEKD